MIDWYSVGFSTLWIIGLGSVIAALSFAYYLANQHKQRIKWALEMPGCRIMIGLGLVLFCLGWAGSVPPVWERGLWAALALGFAVQTWRFKTRSNS